MDLIAQKKTSELDHLISGTIQGKNGQQYLENVQKDGNKPVFIDKTNDFVYKK